jgi:cell division protein FtsB
MSLGLQWLLVFLGIIGFLAVFMYRTYKEFWRLDAEIAKAKARLEALRRK